MLPRYWMAGVCSAAAMFVSGAFAGEAVQHVDAEACKQCHEEIYTQWAGSMHANSSALKDPIHGAFYKNVVGDPTQEGVKMAILGYSDPTILWEKRCSQFLRISQTLASKGSSC